MNPATRGIFALFSAAMLSLLPWLVELSSYWILLLVPVMGLAAAAAFGGRISGFDDPHRSLEVVSIGVLIVGIFVFGLSVYALLQPSSALAAMGLLVGVTAVSSSAFLMSRPGRQGISTVVFFAAYTVTVLWVLAENHPFIDVSMFQQEASAVLAEGVNPYSITFLDHYGALSHIYYGSGVSVDGVLQFGYPYPPLGLLVVAPFEWLLSDFRVAHAFAIIAAGILMSQFGKGRVSRAAAAGFLLVAPVPYIVIHGWTEPLLVLALVLVLFANTRSTRSIPYLYGLVVALKQYAILLLPTALLLRPRPWSIRQIGSDLVKVGAVVVVVTLPFFLWNPGAFLNSVVELQFLQPFRFDSIALPALWAEHFGEPTGSIVVLMPLVGVALATVAAWLRTPTGSQGFALASAVTLLVAFALSKQAFANYHLTVVALFFSAAALVGRESAHDAALLDVASSVPSVESGPGMDR